MQTRSMLLNYEIFGDKGPLIIMIHGLGSALQTFLSLAKIFSTSYKVLLVDQLGHGTSPEAQKNNYSLQNQASAIHNLLKSLELQNEKAILLGHSFGARTACQFTQDYPQNVRGLIIEDMDFVQRSKGSRFEDAVNQSKMKKQGIPMEASSKREMASYLSHFFGPMTIAHILDKRATQIGQKFHLLFKPWVTPLYAYHSAKSDFSNFILQTNIPVLCICAKSFESAVSHSGLMDIRRIHREKVKEREIFEVAQIKGAGHNVHGTKEPEFVSIMEDFLKLMN